ncbi:unnamed protein product [Rhizophagus irregularis]|nr:unnamed protein product [Rhizophagus irregularis]
MIIQINITTQIVSLKIMEQTWLEKSIRKKHINFHKYGDFENIEIIGRGAHGRVSKAEWVNRDMCIAIKSIKVFSNTDEDIWKNFIKELKNHRKVDYHKNIIRFYGISKDPTLGEYLMILEYANQGTLRNYLQNPDRIKNWSIKSKFAKELTSGMKCLHEEGIIHRDLHSNNVLVHDHTIKIADLDKKSDVYSVGVLLWEISSERPPFEKSTNKVSTMLSIVTGNREQPVTNTPLEYQSLYIKCWDDDPKKRPSMKDVSEKLKKMNLNHKSQLQLPSQSFCLTSSTSSDKITSSSSSYTNDFSVSISDELEEIKKMADDKINNKENNNTQGSKEDNEKIIISEDENFLNILVTIFVNSINNGDEYYQTAISLFCFIEENNKDPNDILKLLKLTQAIEHHSFESENIAGKCLLGYCYQMGFGTEKDDEKAVECTGLGVKKDETKAFKWFKESAEGGHVSAQYNLGVYYNFGIGTKTDKVQAKLWYEIAIEGGHDGAKDRLKKLLSVK